MLFMILGTRGSLRNDFGKSLERDLRLFCGNGQM
jgi:hypothetical protein